MRKMHRAGTTLIETVVLGTLVSLTLTTMSMFTHLLLKSSQQIADRGQVRSAVARLQEHLDRDSANAPFVATRSDSGETIWRSVLADGKPVEYRSALRTVDRQVLGAAGQVQQRDQFRLPPTYRFTPVSAPAKIPRSRSKSNNSKRLTPKVKHLGIRQGCEWW